MRKRGSWYSGSCRRVCIVDRRGVVTTETSVYVFRQLTELRRSVV